MNNDMRLEDAIKALKEIVFVAGAGSLQVIAYDTILLILKDRNIDLTYKAKKIEELE